MLCLPCNLCALAPHSPFRTWFPYDRGVQGCAFPPPSAAHAFAAQMGPRWFWVLATYPHILCTPLHLSLHVFDLVDEV